jgi:hypothetical protein
MLYLGHAWLLHREHRDAESAYRRSIAIRSELSQPSLSLEPRAGLVETYLDLDDIQSAMRETETILASLESGITLDGVEEPLRIYYACYLALHKTNDPRTDTILRTAMDVLETQISKFRTAAERDRYVENISWRRAIQDAAATNQN